MEYILEVDTEYYFLISEQMAKKRKLNSKNPKWNKDIEKKEFTKRILMKQVKGCKIYFVWEQF